MNKKDIVSTFIQEALNTGNTDVIEKLIHKDYRYTSPSDKLAGQSELKAFVSALRVAFPDLHVDATDQLEDGSKVCTRISLKGTHTGPFLDIPPAGETIDVEGVVISRFQDDLIKEEWELLDQYKFLTQLGVIQHAR